MKWYDASECLPITPRRVMVLVCLNEEHRDYSLEVAKWIPTCVDCYEKESHFDGGTRRYLPGQVYKWAYCDDMVDHILQATYNNAVIVP